MQTLTNTDKHRPISVIPLLAKPFALVLIRKLANWTERNNLRGANASRLLSSPRQTKSAECSKHHSQQVQTTEVEKQRWLLRIPAETVPQAVCGNPDSTVAIQAGLWLDHSAHHATLQSADQRSQTVQMTGADRNTSF